MKNQIIFCLACILQIFWPKSYAQTNPADSVFKVYDTLVVFETETQKEYIQIVHQLVYREVDTFPLFKLCEKDPKPQECSKKYLLDCMYNYIQYPDSAKKNKIQGVVYASFIVDENGNRSHPKITRGLGYECDEEVLRFISVLPPMLPARRKGRAVAYEYIMPVKFQLKK
ncbi:MAG: energy transducer TonB [Saprospiraceae bacterium]|nr:energy transducer TonB [Saprospiraceae bacterium]